MTKAKEIYKEFNEAKRHFKKAIELAKKSMIVGEINFPGNEKKVRMKKTKTTTEPERKEIS